MSFALASLQGGALASPLHVKRTAPRRGTRAVLVRAAVDPERDVIALEGDGAMLMTGMELMTAARYGIGVVVVLLRDGELAQIAQFQRTALARQNSTTLHDYDAADLPDLRIDRNG